MKLRNLREELPANSSALAVGQPSDYTSDGSSGISPVMTPYGTAPKKGKSKKEEEKILKQMDGRKATYESFRKVREYIKEWYVDDYEIGYVETEFTDQGMKTKPKIMTVKNNVGGVTVKDGTIDNQFGHRNIVPASVKVCPKCNSTNCKCGTGRDRKTEENYKKNLREDLLKESGGKNIDKLQKIAETGKMDELSFSDGNTMKVDSITAKKILQVYDALPSASDLTTFRERANSSMEDFKKIIDFAKGNAA